MQKYLLPGGGYFAFAALGNVLLAVLVGQVVGALLWKFAYEVDSPGDGPGEQTGQPEVTPDTPREEVGIEIGASKDQREADQADYGEPAKVAIEHVFNDRFVFDEALATLNRVVEGDQDTETTKDYPGNVEVKRLFGDG